jgi:hypothetical protein
MQSDVKSNYRTTTGTMVSGEHRLKGLIVVPSATGGTAVFKDGGASGTTTLTVPTIASATGDPMVINIPDNGIRHKADIHVTLTDVAAVTAFYD